MNASNEHPYDIAVELNNPYGIRKSKVSRDDITDELGNLSVYRVEQLLKRGVRLVDLPLVVSFYARVSTDEEVQLHSLKSQIGYYNHMIKSNPNWTFYRGYWDEGISGTSVRKREQFSEMIRDAHAHQFDLIITKEISRFARNTMDSLQYTRELLRRGVGVYFESDGVLTLEPDSEFRLTIMSSVAQEESRKTSERVRRGNRISVENHVVLGNNRIYGFKKDKGKLVIDEQEAVMVKMIFDLFTNKLYGLRKIARILYDKGYRSYAGGRISETTISRILRNPKYKGFYCGGKTTKHRHLSSEIVKIPEENWVMFKDESGEIVPALVSEELWKRTQDLLERKSQVFAESGTVVNFKGSYTYSGKIMCEEHETAYCRSVYRNKRKNGTLCEREVWQCAAYVKQGRKACDKPTIYTDDLNRVVVDMVNGLLENKESIANRIAAICEEAATNLSNDGLREAIQTEIDQIKKRRDKLLDILLAGRINDVEFDSRNKTMTDEIEQKERSLAELRAQEQAVKNFPAEGEKMRKAIESILEFADGFNRRIVDTLLDLIIVRKESSKKTIYLDIYLRCQDYTQPIRYKKTNGEEPMYCCSGIWFMPKGGTSHENASVCASGGNCSCTDRSERVAAQRTICLRSEDWWLC